MIRDPQMAVSNTQQVSDLASQIVRDVAELPGDDYAESEAMHVSAADLRIIVERNLTDALEASHHAELVRALRTARNQIVAAMIGPQMTVGAAKVAVEPIDALLAKIGGDA